MNNSENTILGVGLTEEIIITLVLNTVVKIKDLNLINSFARSCKTLAHHIKTNVLDHLKTIKIFRYSERFGINNITYNYEVQSSVLPNNIKHGKEVYFCRNAAVLKSDWESKEKNWYLGKRTGKSVTIRQRTKSERQVITSFWKNGMKHGEETVEWWDYNLRLSVITKMWNYNSLQSVKEDKFYE